VIQLVSQGISSVLAISLAMLGWGYWALVAQTLIGQVIRASMSLAMSGYRPGRPSTAVETRSLLSFGGYLTVSTIVTYFARNSDNILVGRFLGAEALGIYTRAYFLMTLPTMFFAGSIARVMVPALSALALDKERMERAFRKAVRALAYIGLPAGVGLALTAPEAVRLVYGPGWDGVVAILAWLSLAMVTDMILNSSAWLYMITGNTRRLLLQNVFFTSFLLLFFAVGIRYGTTGVAIAYTLQRLLMFLPHLYLSHRTAGISLLGTLKTMRGEALATAVMAVLVVLAGWLADMTWSSWGTTLVCKVAVGLMAYLAMSWIWLRPLPLPLPDRLVQMRQLRFLKAWV
jgi:PST family polysaccharide transporter